VPSAQFNKTKPTHPKKEDTVDQEKVKENVLRVLGRKGRMTISSLKLFAAAEETKESFRAAVDALASEGKVEKEAGIRAGSFYVALPGTPEPTGTAKKVAPSNDATVPSKKPRRVNRPAARATGEPGARNRKTAAMLSEPSPISMAIVELELQRTKIDVAIEALRELA
jgi:hypothetical protein